MEISNTEEEKVSISIKSGSKNKSINHYIKKICKNILNSKKIIELNACGKFVYF